MIGVHLCVRLQLGLRGKVFVVGGQVREKVQKKKWNADILVEIERRPRQLEICFHKWKGKGKLGM